MIKGKNDEDHGLPRPRIDSQAGAGPLAQLLAYISDQTPKDPGAKGLGEPPEIEYFQKTWERLSTGLRLQQARQQVPENAGPLNSTQLIHRALSSMQESSPAYLQHFLSYVETLSWLDQLEGNSTGSAAKAATRTVSKAGAHAASRTAKAPGKKPARRSK